MRGPGAQPVPASLRLVATDVVEHPGSAIGEITARTGLPQSYVSQTVARLRERGVLETAPDPRDRRRTIVQPSARIPERVERQGSNPVEGPLGEALDIEDEQEIARLTATLEELLARLRARRSP